jgi:hypothetical protein
MAVASGGPRRCARSWSAELGPAPRSRRRLTHASRLLSPEVAWWRIVAALARPVTPEVAGSSPVAPVFICRDFVASRIPDRTLIPRQSRARLRSERLKVPIECCCSFARRVRVEMAVALLDERRVRPAVRVRVSKRLGKLERVSPRCDHQRSERVPKIVELDAREVRAPARLRFGCGALDRLGEHCADATVAREHIFPFWLREAVGGAGAATHYRAAPRSAPPPVGDQLEYERSWEPTKPRLSFALSAHVATWRPPAGRRKLRRHSRAAVTALRLRPR